MQDNNYIRGFFDASCFTFRRTGNGLCFGVHQDTAGRNISPYKELQREKNPIPGSRQNRDAVQSGRQNGILWVHGYVLSAAFCAAVPVHYRKADEIHFGNGAPVFLHCDFQADVGFGKQLHQEK